MKLPRDASVPALVDRKQLRAALFYGPDGGLAHERAVALVTHVAGSTDDAFRVVELPATALKGDLEREVEAELGGLEWTTPAERAAVAEKRSQARMQGFTGEACGECGNFTLVRNGTCLKCDTCGGTSGCS